jgi:hypothetical protein
MREKMIFLAVAFSVSSILATLWVGILKDKQDESDTDF